MAQPGRHGSQCGPRRSKLSHRTPEPRFSAAEFPYRTTYARVEAANGSYQWRILEKDKEYSREPNPHGLLPVRVPVLVTCFTHKTPNVTACNSHRCSCVSFAAMTYQRPSADHSLHQEKVAVRRHLLAWSWLAPASAASLRGRHRVQAHPGGVQGQSLCNQP